MDVTFCCSSDSRSFDFSRAEFGGPVYFSGATATSGVDFWATRFLDRAYFDTSDLGPIRFGNGSPLHTVFRDRVSFRKARLSEVDFSDVQFRARADFYQTRFLGTACFDRATFEEVVNFEGATFEKDLSLEEISFDKGADVSWQQLAGSLRSENPATYAALEQTFEKENDLASRNEARYKKERYLEKELSGRKQFWPLAQKKLLRWLCGYGVRPSFVVGWLLLAYALFFVLHAGDAFVVIIGQALVRLIRPFLRFARRKGRSLTVASRVDPWGIRAAGALNPVKEVSVRTVLRKSLRATFSLDWKEAMGNGTLYLVQYLVMKSLLLLFAYTIANVSPLLQALTKILPV